MQDFAAERRDSLVRYLRKHTAGEVRFDDTSRHLYATDASHYQIRPLGVVIPRTPDDLTAAVQIAADLGVPITARGGGTSLSGQSIGPGLVIDCSKYLNGIGEVDVTGRARPRAAGRRARSTEPRTGPLRADLRAGCGDRQPGHARRHDRQQLRRGTLDRLRPDGRSRPLARRDPLRRFANTHSARCRRRSTSRSWSCAPAKATPTGPPTPRCATTPRRSSSGSRRSCGR